MRIAYLECFSGISGDMFMGALVDAGVPPSLLQNAVAALNVGARLEISRVVRSGISATKVDVWVHGEKDLPREEYRERRSAISGSASARRHEPEPNHEHGDDKGHDHLHARGHSHSLDHGRGIAEIRKIICAAAISEEREKPRHGLSRQIGGLHGGIEQALKRGGNIAVGIHLVEQPGRGTSLHLVADLGLER